jgi:hypothetical protein
LSLLNDVPVLPREVLRKIHDYPVCDTELYGDYLSKPDELLTRSDVEEGLEIVAFDDDIRYDGAARAIFAWKRDCLVYHGGLDGGHWLQPFIRDLDIEELSIELANETHSASFEGEWVWILVRFCDSYRIKIGNDIVEIDDSALYEGENEGGRVIVPQKDASGYVLKQISEYRDEYDGFQESAHESDMDAFQSFVVANTTTDPSVALHRLMPVFSGCPSLYGKSFVVTLDDSGKVASVTAA